MLTPVLNHEWDVTPDEARALQAMLAPRFSAVDSLGDIELVAGVDVGLRGGHARAAVSVHALPGLERVEEAIAERPLAFPYVPGLLTFREGPAVLAALAQLKAMPEVILFDGQGYAHPRRLGLATHIGILLDWPTIGCAKSRLVGEHDAVGERRGCRAPLYDKDQLIGCVVRTRSRVRPLYVSVGQRVGLEHAVEIVLACGSGYRLPEPTRWAHRLASGS